MTWSGGSKAIAKSDFSPLSERNIVIWPDNDKPGMEAAASIYKLLAGKAKSIRIVPPDLSLPEGWDLADKHIPAKGFAPRPPFFRLPPAKPSLGALNAI